MFGNKVQQTYLYSSGNGSSQREQQRPLLLRSEYGVQPKDLAREDAERDGQLVDGAEAAAGVHWGDLSDVQRDET